ncbi:flavodoxin family protein [Tenacibaculum agarivorans]|uniref:flavodoxin family protein n=1 Tax=Tenacibaculum agarivorans TaxID=1908389 RepID=UPI00094BAC96|nr:NAD(P)H-dependent oxidoreductase [Tenacibaculum agarivorans]
MNKNKLILQASSNAKGNTYKIVTYLNQDNQFDIIDLSTKNIGHFNYNFENANDDFLPLMEEIIEKYDTIVFATPVYWYSMSGILKVFFDRLSDLLHYKKELGRKLRGKKMAMISNSGENDRRDGFEMPFIESAKYLGMEYLGDTHAFFTENEIDNHAKHNINTLKNKL